MTQEEINPEGHTDSFIILVNEREYRFREALVTGRQILEKANLLPIDCHELYLERKGHDLRRILPEEEVIVSQPENNQFVTKEPDIFHYSLDKQRFTSDKHTITPLEVLQSAGIDPQIRYLVQELSDGQEIIYAFKPDQPIRVRCPGLIFITREWLEVVDVEDYGKHCKAIPPAHHYKIRIDKSYRTFDKPYITGKEVLELEHKTPVNKFDVFAFFQNRPKPQKVGLEEVFHLTQLCFTRFVIQPKEQQDGMDCRCQFSLPEEDTVYLDKTGLTWETIKNGGLWLILHNYPLPRGYHIATADLALMIPPNYPAVEIDMVYFYPDLRRLNGTAIRAISPQYIDAILFQRWSRHRQPGEWRPGIDDISTHLVLVDQWLINELSR